MNVLEDLAYHLEWCGLGTVADKENDGDIYWARMPDTPDDAVCIFSTDSGTGGPKSVARFQIMTRSASSRKAYERACAIADELEGFNDFLHGDGRQAIIEVINSGAGLGADTKKREIYVTNISMRYCN